MGVSQIAREGGERGETLLRSGSASDARASRGMRVELARSMGNLAAEGSLAMPWFAPRWQIAHDSEVGMPCDVA